MQGLCIRLFVIPLIFFTFLTLVLVQPLKSMAQAGEFPSSITVSTNTSTSTEPHPLSLKAVQGGGSQIFNAQGFNLDTANVISAQSNSQISIFSPDTVREAKVKPSTSENRIDL
jgi:hypothetical protein